MKHTYISNIKRKLRDTRGFTLVELITAMALLSIVTVMLFTICTGAITLIYRNSNKLDTVSGAKTNLNNILSGQTTTASPTESVQVTFGTGGTSVSVVVPGQKVSVESSKKDNKSKMEAFIPN